MSSPHTRLMSEDEEMAYDSGLIDGRDKERERIIKLLEEMPWQIYVAVSIDGKPIESVKTPKTLLREDAIALIKGENK